MSRVRQYPGDGFVINFDSKRCIHAEECVHGLPGVFDPRQRPWIDPGQAGQGEIAEVVRRCPTGALYLQGGEPEPVPEVNRATVSAHGPLYLHGDLELTLPNGTISREKRAALCRCGASRNKPFCDNAHTERRFLDEGRLHAAGGEPAGTGPVKIKFPPNGPLLALGPLRLESSDSTTSRGTTKIALCRCGASKEKPLCDGSHLVIGFKAD